MKQAAAAYQKIDIIEELSRQQEHIDALFMNMPQAYSTHEIIYDKYGNSEDYVFHSVNKAFEDIIGIKAKDLEGKKVSEVFPLTEKEWIIKYAEVAQTGKPIHAQRHYKEMNRWFDIVAFSPSKNRFAVIFEEITAQKADEQKYREKSGILAIIAENMRDIVGIMRQDGTYKYISPSVQRFGYTPEEFASMSLLDIVHPDGRQDLEEKIKSAFEGTCTQSYICRLRTKDGKYKYFETNNKMSETDGEKHLITSARDITERIEAIEILAKSEMKTRETAQQLAKSELKYRTIAENTFDMETWTDNEGKFIYLSPSAANSTGYTSEEFLADDGLFLRIIHPEDRKAMKEHMENQSEEAQSPMIFRITKKDGSDSFLEHVCKKVYNESGNPIGRRASNRNVTDRIRMQEALEESEEKFRAITMTAKNAIVLADQSGAVIFWNKAAEDMFDYSESEIKGKNIMECIAPESQVQKIRDGFAKFAGQKNMENTNKTYEMEAKRRDGTLFPAEILLSTFTVKNKRYAAAIIRDRTSRIEATKKLEHALEAAKAADRFKETLMQNMSHEFRTPFHGIIGMNNLLIEDIQGSTIGDDEKQRLLFYTEKIDYSAKRMFDTFEKILEVSHLTSRAVKYEIGTYSTNDITKGIFDRHAAEAKKAEITFKFTSHEGAPNALCDLRSARESFGYVLENAIKYTTEGSIEVSAYEIAEPGKKWAVIGIKDTGIGISPEKITQIFEVFRQSSEGVARKYEGTGLGLSIAKQHLENMGGRITVESAQGKGSEFRIYLPAQEAMNAVDAEKAPAPGQFPGLRHRRFLFVDDNAITTLVGEKHLKSMGIANLTVDKAKTSKEATGLAARNRYDIIFMDLNLADGSQTSGIDATREIRAIPHHANTPVVAVTGYQKSDFKSFGIEEDFFTSILGKPYEKPDLRRETALALFGDEQAQFD